MDKPFDAVFDCRIAVIVTLHKVKNYIRTHIGFVRKRLVRVAKNVNGLVKLLDDIAELVIGVPLAQLVKPVPFKNNGVVGE